MKVCACRYGFSRVNRLLSVAFGHGGRVMLFRLRHLRFLPTPLALCLLDYALTLHGQPAAYWGGDSAVSELSPETRRLLANGVLASAAGLALWIAVVIGLLLLLPRPAALFVAVTIGHTVGATTWLWNWPAGGYQAGLWLCLTAALGLVTTIIWDERTRLEADAGSEC